MNEATNLLIVGAGPFGLGMAAHAGDLGIDYVVAGKSMEFWRDNMPRGMYLRSTSDWHLDVSGRHTIEAFLALKGMRPLDGEPLPRQTYISYALWFQEQKRIEPIPTYVESLDWMEHPRPMFQAVLADGRMIKARQVVVAVGSRYFRNVPRELECLVPAGRFAHTCDLVDFTGLEGKRCLILGGRQSAFEWAALLREAGAAAVHVAYRHPTPAFAASDWAWAGPLVDGMVENPGWFRHLPQDQQETLKHRLWAEGHLKVEPWLAPRVLTEGIQLWPVTQVTGCVVSKADPGGDIAVQLDNGICLTVDQIILATGYKVRIEQVPFLAAGNILPRLATRNGFPVLDERFQTNIPGLFITSMLATQDFGPFFAFTVSVRASAKIIGDALLQDGSRQASEYV